MATKLTKPVSRAVVDEHGKPLIVTITTEGITFRRPRHKDEFLLPYAAGESRAITMKHGIGQATAKTTRGGKVSRGLFTMGR